MISVYIKSVVVWTIILCATAKMLSGTLEKRGWISTSKIGLKASILMAAIPILRIITWASVIGMAFIDNPDKK